MNLRLQSDLIASLFGYFGKFLFASLFWWDGIFIVIPNFNGLIIYIENHDLPYPDLIAYFSLLFLIFMPVMLFIKFLETYAFLSLAAFCILTAFIFHPFWYVPQYDKMSEEIQFFKDIALAGAMLIIVSMRKAEKQRINLKI